MKRQKRTTAWDGLVGWGVPKVPKLEPAKAILPPTKAPTPPKKSNPPVQNSAQQDDLRVTVREIESAPTLRQKLAEADGRRLLVVLRRRDVAVITPYAQQDTGSLKRIEPGGLAHAFSMLAGGSKISYAVVDPGSKGGSLWRRQTVRTRSIDAVTSQASEDRRQTCPVIAIVAPL